LGAYTETVGFEETLGAKFKRDDSLDRALISALQRLSETDPEYWTFRFASARLGNHGLTQYPAMMVPKMVEGILGAILSTQQGMNRAYDPFVGSGTTLVECLRHGTEFTAQDINPLAILMCQVKSGPFMIERLKSGVQNLELRLKDDTSNTFEAKFTGINKWFKKNVIIALSRIRRAVRGEENRWVRRVFWLAIAETVRLTSNSRPSTFKLHIKSKSDLQNDCINTYEVFRKVLANIVQSLEVEANELRKRYLLGPGGSYGRAISLKWEDSRCEQYGENGVFDLLITSPPYGDNTSTVPYGQYSFLPLQWIDLDDVRLDIDPSILESAYVTDSRSLGGSRKLAIEGVQELRKRSAALDQILESLSIQPRDRAGRVAAFCRDLNESINSILPKMRPGSIMVWITGNRKVGGLSVPLDEILAELLTSRQCSLIHRISRRIPSKRMATRNSVSNTMREECIQIFRVE